ncbi:MAG TPA: ChbG/HpnK family deacetylase [Bryobacteraceae bacterium]
MKTLLVNADDFGFTRDVNSGIIEAHTSGILTATTLMANGAAFDDAIVLARETPTLDVGCHLVLVGGSSLVTGRPFPVTVRELLRTIVLRRIDPYAELKAQIQRIVDAGLRPVHMDTHKHTHLFPPVLDAVARLSREFGIRWIRRPFDFPMESGGMPLSKRLVSSAFGIVRPRLERVLRENGCRSTDYFAGFSITGRFGARQVVELIRALPEGSTEFMVHPGHCTDELRATRTRLKESRAQELAALVAPEVRRALDEAGVKLSGYRALGS